jgi:ornithine cyclodeaminase
MLDADDVRKAVPMRAAIDAVREAFLELAAGRFEVPQRLSFADGTTLVMTACHKPTSATAVKTLSLIPGRIPMILGTLVWNTAEGQVVADAVEVTTLRTGAVSGVATDLLAAPEAHRLALLGTGAQAADQVRAVAAVRSLSHVSVFGRDISRAQALVERLSAELPEVAVRLARQVSDAVADADVVCCATSSSTPLFAVDDLPERVHVNAIGSYLPSLRELPPELLATAECVVVDQVSAAMTEAGEVIHAVEAGLVDRGSLLELGAALGNPPAVGGRTVFKSVGLAVQDWAVGRLLGEAVGRARSEEASVGEPPA